jgi:hypothetical protein
MVEDGFYSSCI